MKEIKVFESKLVVGKLDYEELHNNIINCHNLLDIKKLYDIINKKFLYSIFIFFILLIFILYL
jgi:phage pi2 protein 07